MHLPRFLLLAPLCACLLPAMAQEQTAAPGDTASQEMQQVVDVQGTRDPDLRPYRTMLKGLDAYADTSAWRRARRCASCWFPPRPRPGSMA